MEFDAARLVSSIVFGISAGLICSSVTKKLISGGIFVLIIAAVIPSFAGLWRIWAVYPLAAAAMTAVLTAKKAALKDAAAAAVLSSASAFIILVFTSAVIAPCLEAYSYTLRDEFYYYAVHSIPVIAVALSVAVVLMPVIIWLCRSREKTGGMLAICVISMSLAAVAIMILHMCAGQIVDYNAKYFKLPLPYSLLTGSIALLCSAISCIFIKALGSGLHIPEKLGGAKEFYLILAAIICTVVFYCYENTILNNYTSFDDPRYKYTVSILIVLMILTILAALLAVCSYILRTRAEQAHMEKEMEITSVYRNEIQNMQREIFDFKHDYVKIYSSMSTFILNREYDKLSDFFESNITPLQKELFSMDEDARAITLIEDEAVQGLVYSYIIKAKKSGVTLLTDIRDQIPPVSVPVIDLNRLLGIFLDNAIEQAAQSDKNVGFAAVRNRGCVVFVIANSSEGVDVEKMFNRGESSKGSGRGRGLAIARKICTSHDELSLNTYSKNGKFICEIYVDLEPV